jgi:hypothetical protein
VPHRGAGDAWRAHQTFPRAGVLCREVKGLKSLGVGHRGADALGRRNSGTLGSWEAGGLAGGGPNSAGFQVSRAATL